MTKRLHFGPDLFLVCLGRMTPLALDTSTLYPDSGLVVTQTLAGGGEAHLLIRTPTDLVGLADLAAVTVMKPVCLPLVLNAVRPAAIEASIAATPPVIRLAEIVLRALSQPEITHPEIRAASGGPVVPASQPQRGNP